MDPPGLILTTKIALGGILALLGLILLAGCYPLVRGSVKMNHWYGVRTEFACQSEENWLKANREGGKVFMAWGAVMLVLGIGIILMPFMDPLLAILFFLAGGLSILVPLVLTLHIGKK